MMRILQGILLSLILLFLICVLGGLGAGIYIVQRYSADLPDVDKLKEYKPSLVSKVYSRDGVLLSEFYLEKRFLIPISSVPQDLINATIAIEDSDFYQHGGINLRGIMRAMIANIKAGRIVEGGSTITQQLARSLFLKHEVYIKRQKGKGEVKTVYARKYSRKIKEILLALQMERKLGKKEILQMYFNEIYYGHGAYGVEAAAMHYFGKHAYELDTLECIAIAALPKSPNGYSPFRNPHRNKKRRSLIIDRMEKLGYLSAEKAAELKHGQLKLAKPSDRINMAPYFVEYIRRWLEDYFGSAAVHTGGLKVHTSLDSKLQAKAEQALEKGLRELDKRQGFRGAMDLNLVALMKHENTYTKGSIITTKITRVENDKIITQVRDAEGIIDAKGYEWTKEKSLVGILKPGDWCQARILETPADDNPYYLLSLEQEPLVEGSLLCMDVHNGEILAWVGGRSFDRSQFDRVYQAKRQPGSSFKLFIYTAALDTKYTPATIIYDSPIIEEIIKDEEEPEKQQKLEDKLKEIEKSPQEESEPKAKELWKPANYSEKFYGPTTLREGLVKSRNLVTIKLLNMIGVKLAVRYAKMFGIEGELREDLSLALGSSGVSLYEMTRAYSTIPAMGVQAEPMPIRYIKDHQGNLIYERIPVTRKVIPDTTAYLMADILCDVVDEGTAWRARALHKLVGGKTGTTNEYKDAWFIGFSPDICTGVWVGFDEPKPLGDKETGSRAALPIWVDFMAAALKDKDPKPFEPPDQGIDIIGIDPRSGLISTDRCSEVVNEIFIEGKKPVAPCNLHGFKEDQLVMMDLGLGDDSSSKEEATELISQHPYDLPD